MRSRWIAAIVAVLLAGCERQMHDMYAQPRYDPDEGSTMWADGRADRPPVPGTVAAAAGTLAGTSSGRHGQDVPRQWQAASQSPSPPPVKFTLGEVPMLIASGAPLMKLVMSEICQPAKTAWTIGFGRNRLRRGTS